MRFALALIALAGLVGTASPADPTAPEEKGKDTLKRLEGVWVLKSAVVARPAGVGMVNLNAPNTPKMAIRIKDGVKEMLSDGKPVANGGGRIELGSEADCLLWHGRPDKQPFKLRFRIEDDTLTIVQDMAFQEECPESFDPEKGRNRDRRVLTFTRERQKP